MRISARRLKTHCHSIFLYMWINLNEIKNILSNNSKSQLPMNIVNTVPHKTAKTLKYW